MLFYKQQCQSKNSKSWKVVDNILRISLEMLLGLGVFPLVSFF